MNRVVVQDVEGGPLRMHIGSGIPKAFATYTPPSEEFYNNASLLFVVDGVCYVDATLKQAYEQGVADAEQAQQDEEETRTILENRIELMRAQWQNWDNLSNGQKLRLLKRAVSILLRERVDD